MSHVPPDPAASHSPDTLPHGPNAGESAAVVRECAESPSDGVPSTVVQAAEVPSAEVPSVEMPSGGDGNRATARRNYHALALHQIVFRVAWIFKTESVIMPAFMDMIADSGLIRGMLPLLNRCGQSVAPLLLADRISGARLKSRALRRSTTSMSLPFFVLAGSIWLCRGTIPSWFAVIYLLAYAVFFCLHGVNETSYSTVQGKLIPVAWRGRLVAVSNTVGSLVAVCLAWWLLGAWLQSGGPDAFAKIFLFVGSVMFSASLATLLLQETGDTAPGPRVQPRQHFRDAYRRLRQDAVLRGLCLIAGMFVFSQLLFPHYQRLGLELPGAEPVLLMDWVIAQHLGAAAFSNIAGQLADRLGTRAALRLLTAAAACAPLLALGLAWWAPLKWYCLAFFWIGVIPVTLRMQVNYLLEIVARSEHPSYISTMGLCMALPFLLSPLIGAMVQWLGFTPPFVFVAAIVAVAACRTWLMPEPRHFRSPPAEPAPVLTPR